MDELLSLFAEDDGPGGDEPDATVGRAGGGGGRVEAVRASSSSDGDDALGKAFGDAFGGRAAAGSKGKHGSAAAARKDPSNVPKAGSAGGSKGSGGELSCDPFTGLRIVDRRTSRADMVDAFSSLTYRSCSALAAASRAEWTGQYLVDGGTGTGPPSGRTVLATCGVLTNDPSSRLSSKTGRAFAVLSLGDLPSSMSSKGSGFSSSGHDVRASVSVFLFGDALGALRTGKKYLRSGWAVAVLGPNLMPPRDGDKGGGGATSVTLSVGDPRQILPIGRAADCDRCKGTTRKRLNGGTRWEEVRCGSLVDLRLGGGYCLAHRRQGLSSGGGSGKGKGANETFVQRQRREGTTGTWRGGTSSSSKSLDLHMRPGLGSGPSMQAAMPTSNRLSGSSAGALQSRSSSVSAMLSMLEPDLVPAAAEAKGHLLRRAPLHMKKLPGPASANVVAGRAAASRDATAKTKNPYKSEDAGRDESKKRKEPRDFLGEALARKKSRPANASMGRKPVKAASTRPCKVFDPEGYDGAVRVPQPSKVLFRRGAATPAARVTPSHVARGASAETVLNKQRHLAGLLKEKGGGVPTPTPKKRGANVVGGERLARSKQKILVDGCGSLRTAPNRTARALDRDRGRNGDGAASASGGDDAFASAFGGSREPLDRDAIFNARSRLASVVDAEEYARARSVVQELECREASKDERGPSSAGKDGRRDRSLVTSGWACRTCKKKTPYKPVSCIRSRHDVRQRREIRSAAVPAGTRKERLDRHGRDAEEGGLMLGSGLEWSGWRGGLS